MIGFPLTRKRLGRGGMNPLAYLGMTGDIAVIAGLYFYFKQRKINKEKKKLANRENDLRVMAESFPPKVESIDYNRFSPYTPIPYYVDSTTKYQTEHIDLINYMSTDKQFHVNNYYYSNYHNSLDHENKNTWEYDYHFPDISRWVENGNNGNQHGHSHSHHH
jgi:hypothetical protein